MIKYVYSGAIALLIVGMMNVSGAQAATTPDTLTRIQSLMAQLEILQKQLADLRGEVRIVIKEGLKEGMSSEDIKKVQELLATDTVLYPEGKVTGYFGPLTKEAVKRFQLRHDLAATGEVNAETKKLLEEYLSQGFGDKIPPGLLRAPGIMKKVQEGLCDNSGKGKATGPLCKKVKEGSGDDDNDDNDDTDFEIEIEIEDATTTIEFTYEDESYDITMDSDDIDDVNDMLNAVADELDEDLDDLDTAFVQAIKRMYNEIVDSAEDTEAEDRAEEALEDAEDAIEEAEDAIEDASGDTEDAEEFLEDAEAALERAEDAFDDEEYEDAYDLARDAEELARDAEDAV